MVQLESGVCTLPECAGNGKVCNGLGHCIAFGMTVQCNCFGTKLDPTTQCTSCLNGLFLDGIDCIETKPDIDDGSSLSGGAIAGIVIGALVAVALIGALVFFLLKKKSSSGPVGTVKPSVDAGGDAQTYI